MSFWTSRWPYSYSLFEAWWWYLLYLLCFGRLADLHVPEERAKVMKGLKKRVGRDKEMESEESGKMLSQRGKDKQQRTFLKGRIESGLRWEGRALVNGQKRPKHTEFLRFWSTTIVLNGPNANQKRYDKRDLGGSWGWQQGYWVQPLQWGIWDPTFNLLQLLGPERSVCVHVDVYFQSAVTRRPGIWASFHIIAHWNASNGLYRACRKSTHIHLDTSTQFPV